MVEGQAIPTNKHFMAIFFADIVGSTSMYEQLGDNVAQKLVTDCLDIMISIVIKSGGTLIKTVGDEVMASFLSCDAALQAAIDVQITQQYKPIKVRVGFHYGSVIEKNRDYFGNTVNIAARLVSRATASEILTTEQTAQQLSPVNRQNIRYLSSLNVKGKEELVSIYKVFWEAISEDDLTITTKKLFEPTDVELELVYREQTFKLNSHNSCLTIGRSIENDLIINHEFASRKHAKIELNGSKFKLTDTSTNGTVVVFDNNQSSIIIRESAELIGNGLIQLGAYRENIYDNPIKFRRISNI